MKVTKPSPSWPMMLAAGTSTSSKITSEVEEARMPSFFSMTPILVPISFSTTKAVTPPRAPRAGSVTASTEKRSAKGPLLM